jgi:protocatechuate 3,4-dioxygenase beta subunit
MLEPFRLAEGEAKDIGVIRLALGAALRGRVTDAEGRPVENAGISLKDAAGKDVFLFSLFSSGSDGRYEVQGLQLAAYTVRIEAKGYAPYEGRVTIDADGETVDAVLQKGGALAVTVEDEAGNPVSGARVELVDSQGKPVTRTLTIVNLFDADVTRTNDQGKATIPDLAPGSYQVGAKKDGMALAADRSPASVSSGGTANVRVVLKTAP